MPPCPLIGCPDHLRPLLRRCATGELSPAVTLMHLLLETGSAERVGQIVRSTLIRDEAAARRLGQLRRLLDENEPAMRRLAEMLRDAPDHAQAAASPDAGIKRCRTMFDRLSRLSPEASVALYSLGSPALLEAATREVVAAMREWGLIAPDRTLLEIGCGIGRFQAALAGSVAAVTGIDISGEMIAAARQRCAGLSNVDLRQCSGRDLSPFGEATFDLVFAVDSFPYLMQAGGAALVARHFEEAARVLKPGGDLLILNFSYRGDVERDRADAVRLATLTGFAVIRDGMRPFSIWDGLAFHLRRPMRSEPCVTAGHPPR